MTDDQFFDDLYGTIKDELTEDWAGGTSEVYSFRNETQAEAAAISIRVHLGAQQYLYLISYKENRLTIKRLEH